LGLCAVYFWNSIMNRLSTPCATCSLLFRVWHILWLRHAMAPCSNLWNMRVSDWRFVVVYVCLISLPFLSLSLSLPRFLLSLFLSLFLYENFFSCVPAQLVYVAVCFWCYWHGNILGVYCPIIKDCITQQVIVLWCFHHNRACVSANVCV